MIKTYFLIIYWSNDSEFRGELFVENIHKINKHFIYCTMKQQHSKTMTHSWSIEVINSSTQKLRQLWNNK